MNRRPSCYRRFGQVDLFLPWSLIAVLLGTGIAASEVHAESCPVPICCWGTLYCLPNIPCDQCTADGGTCDTITVECDDGNVCVDVSCDPVSGCVYTNNTALCDDGNVCTDDSCDPATGCVYANNTDPCDDENPCTTDDACFDGICVGTSGLGACCVPGIGCVDCVSEWDCTEVLGGGYLGDTVNCAPHICPGACCSTPNAVCEDSVSLGVCEPELPLPHYGCYMGDASRCDVVQCPGACCTVEGCLDCVYSGECDGFYMGEGTACRDLDCNDCSGRSENVGSCVQSDGSCTDCQTSETCPSGSGSYCGTGVICAHTGACLKDDGTCDDCAESVEDCIGTYCDQGTRCTDYGSCFYEGGCADCATLVGCSAENTTLCPGKKCDAVSACILPDGTCQSCTSASECAGASGEYCNPSTSCDQVGACCIGEDCFNCMTEDDCMAAEGFFSDVESVCEDDDFVGACCSEELDGCTHGITEQCCLAASGEYAGDSTFCSNCACSCKSDSRYQERNPPADFSPFSPTRRESFRELSCWVVAAANMLASAGYGNGGTAEARAAEIYDQMIIDVLQIPEGGGRTGNACSALEAWLESDRNIWKEGRDVYFPLPRHSYRQDALVPAAWDYSDGPKWIENRVRACEYVAILIFWKVEEDGKCDADSDNTGDPCTEDVECPNGLCVIPEELTGHWLPAVFPEEGSDGDTFGPLADNPDYGWFTDEYTNPPGTIDENLYAHFEDEVFGTGWYLVYDALAAIDEVCRLTVVSTEEEGHISSSGPAVKPIVVGSYRIRQDNASDDPLGLHYEVASPPDNIGIYDTTIDWDGDVTLMVERVGASLVVDWDLSGTSIPFGTDVTFTTELGLLDDLSRGVECGNAYFTYPYSGPIGPGFVWELVTPLVADPYVENIRGGVVIGAFEVWSYDSALGPQEMLVDYRFASQYFYDEDPEHHTFQLSLADGESSVYFVTNVRFGHSYGASEDDALWAFSDWMSTGPDAVVDSGTPLVAVIDWSGQLPYPPCPLSLRSDFDKDGDVDTGDFDLLSGCFTGSGGGPVEAGCEYVDIDSDDDVDCMEWGVFEVEWTGPPETPPILIQCTADIPALSEWGVVTMTLLVLTAATVVLLRRRVAA